MDICLLGDPIAGPKLPQSRIPSDSRSQDRDLFSRMENWGNWTAQQEKQWSTGSEALAAERRRTDRVFRGRLRAEPQGLRLLSEMMDIPSRHRCHRDPGLSAEKAHSAQTLVGLALLMLVW